MIPRILVPKDVRPVNNRRGRRSRRAAPTTYMDDRTVVPSGTFRRAAARRQVQYSRASSRSACWSIAPWSARHAGQAFEEFTPRRIHVPIAVMDERTVVPAYVEPAREEEIKEFMERVPEMTAGIARSGRAGYFHDGRREPTGRAGGEAKHNLGFDDAVGFRRSAHFADPFHCVDAETISGTRPDASRN